MCSICVLPGTKCVALWFIDLSTTFRDGFSTHPQIKRPCVLLFTTFMKIPPQFTTYNPCTIHTLPFSLNPPVHCKIQWLHSHWRASSSQGCGVKLLSLECWSYCKTQRWGQYHPARGLLYGIPHYHLTPELHDKSLGSHSPYLAKASCFMKHI